MEFGSAFVLSKAINPAVDVDEIDETDYSAGVRSAMSQNVSSRGDNVCLLDILDTAGQEEYSTLRDEYTRTARAFLIVFSITSRSSFEEAMVIYQFCRRLRGTDSPPVVLCANKCDLEWRREVPEDETLRWANSMGIPMFTTSAKLGINVDNAFIKLVQITPRTANVEYKIAVLGAGGVGKSAITVRFVLSTFVETYDPTIEDGYRKQIVVPNLPMVGATGSHASPSKNPSSASGSSTLSKAAKRCSGFFSSLFRSNSRSAAPAPEVSLPTYNEATTTTVEGKSSGSRRKLRKVPKKDTNILALNLGTLSPENFDMLEVKALASPPPACSKCSALLSSSPVCAFCGADNPQISRERLETRRAVEEYTLVEGLRSSPNGDINASAVADTKDRGLVVFCIDISGSMSMTQQVNQLQGMWNSLKAQHQLGSFAAPELPKYVSRLDCIQDAMQVHLDRLEKYFPERKVAIIAFANDLECYIGNAGTRTISALGMNSIEQGMNAARVVSSANWKPVKENISWLRSHVASLNTQGATALGPALAVALGFAREHKQETGASTEIFLCTDGAANNGIGTTNALEMDSTKHGRAFYSQAGEIAIGQSAKINIIGIEGEGVALDVLAVAAQTSGGVVTTVHADELRREIRTASQRRVLAGNVTIKLYAHPDWHFTPDPRPGVTINKNMLTYTLARVDDETSVGFAFGVARASDSKAKSSAMTGTAPFQAQITYTSSSTGATSVRVLNRVMPVTKDREHAEAAVEVALTGTHMLQRIAFEANQVLINNLSFGEAAKTRIGALRDALYASHQLLIRGAKTVPQQEELGNFAQESIQLERELERMMASGGAASKSSPWSSVSSMALRDDAAKAFTRVTALPRNSLLAGSKKVGQVKRRGLLK